MTGRGWGAALLVGLLGCGGGRVWRMVRVAPGEAAGGQWVRVRGRVPASMPRRGTAVVQVYSPAEMAAGMPRDFARWTDNLGRVQAVREVPVVDGTIAVEVWVASRPAVAELVFDTAGLGLEALFGAQPGVARARVQIAAAGAVPTVTLEGRPYAETEDCTGEHDELLVLDAPETRRRDDPGTRRVCVHLPPSYAHEPARRYPVVLAFPGFSGWHARGDAWRERGLFDRIGVETGVEALVVGVGTRTAEGTSYLETSERFGDWDRYVSDRLLRALDARYRTVARRATLGHSTGGWNALALATRHPDLFVAAGSSSPDALDLDVWMLDGGQVRSGWLAWIRAEAALGGRGQFVSYGAAWSPDPAEPLGFRWPIDLASGALRPDVFTRWRRRSPAADLRTEAGLGRARSLSGALVVTAGRRDEFGLFAPTQAYVEQLRAAGVAVTWLPTELGHFGAGGPRFGPLVRFLLERLREVPAIVRGAVGHRPENRLSSPPIQFCAER